HRHAGVLSAYGIGVADIRRYGERPVLKNVSHELIPELEQIALELNDQVVAEVLADGVSRTQLDPPRRMLDLRYAATETPITLEWAPGDNPESLVAKFEREHQRQYGYLRPGRDLECVALRVEVVGRSAVAGEPEQTPADDDPAPAESTTAVFRGTKQQVPVFDRTALAPGHVITGPAVIFEPTSTFVLDPG